MRGHVHVSVPCRVVLGCECSAESTREEHGSHALVHSLSLPPHTPAPPGGGATTTPSSFCTSTKKKTQGAVDVATATECLHVSYVIVVISHAAGPAAPRHPPQRHVKQPAAPGRRAGRAAGRRDHALLRGEVDGPDRGDTVDEETAEEESRRRTSVGTCCMGPPHRGAAALLRGLAGPAAAPEST